MQIKRDLIVGTNLRFQLTFESRCIEAHSLLTDVCADAQRKEKIESHITRVLADIDEIINEGLPQWKSEHPS